MLFEQSQGWLEVGGFGEAAAGGLVGVAEGTPQAHTDYRLRHPATPFYAASTSQAVTVRVGVRLTARLSRPSMALGRTAGVDPFWWTGWS